MRFFLIVLDFLLNLVQLRFARGLWGALRDRNKPRELQRLNAFLATTKLPLWVRSKEEHLAYSLSNPQTLTEVYHVEAFLPEPIVRVVKESGLPRQTLPSSSPRRLRAARRMKLGVFDLWFLLKRIGLFLRIATKLDDLSQRQSVYRHVVTQPRQRERRFARDKRVLRSTRDRVTA